MFQKRTPSETPARSPWLVPDDPRVRGYVRAAERPVFSMGLIRLKPDARKPAPPEAGREAGRGVPRIEGIVALVRWATETEFGMAGFVID